MNFDTLFNLLKNKTGSEIFGTQGKKNPKYKLYATICHPDTAKSPMAKECFSLLELRANESTKGIIITSKNNKYEIERTPIFSGDISDLFLTKDRSMLLKISRDDKHVKLMQKEFNISKKIRLESFEPVVSRCLESFTLYNRNKPKRTVNVFGYNSNDISLYEIHKRRPELDVRSFSWIFRRLLTSLGVLHSTGYVHGAILPQHFLVNKIDHAGKLIDLICAEKIGSVIKTKLKDDRFYSPEVISNDIALRQSDIYSAGKLGIYLLGGNLETNTVPKSVPIKMAGFLRGVLNPNPKRRPDNAWDLHGDFTMLINKLFGKRKYVELKL